jgi:UDP-N-acetylmuramate--alanine ligase
MLTKQGIVVLIPQQAENVPEDIDLLIYSDAVPEDNPERARARERGIREQMYFEALGEVTKGRKTIAVSGTHGKTTTTGMLTNILVDAKQNPTAIIGSIVKDFESNFVAGSSELFVVEACEWRGHFLNLSPYILVITNLEWDHTDFYPNLEAVQKTFRELMERVPSDGAIVTDVESVTIAPLLEGLSCRIIDYKSEEASETLLVGEFNKNNARAASAAARALIPEITTEVMNQSLQHFHGTWRRFEYKGKTTSGAEVYDDYAHHPTAVSETLRAVKEKFPDKKITVAFHPHLYSRTKDLLQEFTNAFIDADHIIIAPIYAAREVDDGTISNHILADKIRETGKDAIALDSFDAIESHLWELGEGDLIITMGAGDIYKVGEKLIA